MWISRSQFRAKVISQNLYFIPCLSFSFESLGIPPKVPTCSYNSLIVSSYSAALMFTSFNFSSCLKTQLPLPFLTFIHINKILDDSFVDSFLPVQSWCVDVHGSFIAKTAITIDEQILISLPWFLFAFILEYYSETVTYFLFIVKVLHNVDVPDVLASRNYNPVRGTWWCCWEQPEN